MSSGIKEYDRGLLIAGAWHRDPRYKIVEVIDPADLAEHVFNYELKQVITGGKLDDGTWVEADEDQARAILRTNPHMFISSMGGKYGLNQPAPFFTTISETCVDAGFTIESAGSLGNGAKAFMSVRLPAEFDFDFQGYSVAGGVLNFGDSCDGTSKMRGTHALNIVVCENTFNAYILGVPALFSIKHTANSEADVDETLRQLDQSFKTTIAIKDAVEKLTNETLVEAEFVKIIQSEFMLGAKPASDAPARTQTMYDNAFASIMARYRHSDIDPIRETKLGALMAVQGHEQHVRAIRNTEKGATRSGRTIAEVVFDGQKASEKMSALLGITRNKKIPALV